MERIATSYRKHDIFQRTVRESLYADREEMDAIRDTARSTGTIVSIGFSEKMRQSNVYLFNSTLIIDDTGDALIYHRKLVPTFFEKLTWSPGDGYWLKVAETHYGWIGALICGENTNPLARYALIAQAEDVHISTWPTRVLKGKTLDKSKNNTGPRSSGNSNYDNLTSNRTHAAAHCFEAKCFGVACAGYLGKDAVDAIVDGSSQTEVIATTLSSAPRAATFFLDPTRATLTGFTVEDETMKPKYIESLQDKEGILYADINRQDCIEGKHYHDVVGGYQRMDVFTLQVDRRRKGPINIVDR